MFKHIDFSGFKRYVFALLAYTINATAFSQINFVNDNVLVGPGASGLGGAFTAIADDPTAIIYNPAGLARIPSNKRSLSYNSYMTAIYSYDKVIFDSELQSEAVFSPFFAGTSYRNTKIFSEWTFAAAAFDKGIYSTRNRWSVSGEDIRSDVETNSNSYSGTYEYASRHSGSALTVALAAARPTPFGIFGFSLGILNESESGQEYSKGFFGPFKIEGKEYYANSIINTDMEAKGLGIECGIGGLWEFDSWTFGAMLRQVRYRFQKSETIEDGYYISTDKNGSPVTTRVGDKDVPSVILSEQSRETDTQPFGKPPIRYRIGLANKLTEATRISADISGRGYSRTEKEKIQPGADLAIGIESFFTNTFSARFGSYLVTDQGNTVSSKGYRRATSYVDSLGVTSLITYKAEGWSLSLGSLLQRGKGEFNGGNSSNKDVNLAVNSFSASFISDQL